MKKYLLFIALLSYGTYAFSQQICNDVIFAVEGNRIIFNCCIKKVTGGNIVVYSKDGETQRIAAVAVSQDGEYRELYPDAGDMGDNFAGDDYNAEVPGYDYQYYKRLYEGSRTRKTFGIFLTFIGVGFEITGIVFSKHDDLLADLEVTSGNLYLAGLIMQSAGVPLWISGAVRAANNKKAMEEIEHKKSLSFGINQDGAGFTFRF